MDRLDTKYVFPRENLSSILEQLSNSYRVLEVNGERISRYESLYFDTHDFNLYNHHQSGRLNRFKIRFRKYVESNLHFFEIKFKNNKGRTIKKRIKQEDIPSSIDGSAADFLKQHSSFNGHDLEEKLWVNYSRLTLVNKFAPERVTIDIDLTFKKRTLVKSFSDLVIAEIKKDKSDRSAFSILMKKLHIREGSISKYCFGALSMYNQLKHNNFKSRLIHLKKISNDITPRH